MKQKRRILTSLCALLLLLVACGEGDDVAVTPPEAEGADATEGSEEQGEAEQGGQETGDATDEEWPTQLTFMTGSTGGVWQVVGAAIAEILEREIDDLQVDVVPGNSASNLVAIDAGEAQIGLSNAFSSVDAVLGRDIFDEPVENVVHLVNLQEQLYHFFVRADTPYEAVEDAAGGAIGTTAPGSAGHISVRDALAAHGLDLESDMGRVEHESHGDLADMVANRQIEIMSSMAPVGASYYLDASTSTEMRLLPLSDEAIAAVQEINAGYLPATIPGGVYPNNDDDVPTFMTVAHLIIARDLPDSFVAELTRTLVDHADDIRAVSTAFESVTVENMAQDSGMEFHPAAESWFVDQGLR